MHKLVNEFLMEADLPLAAKAAVDIEVVEISGPQAVDAFNHSELFATISGDTADRRRTVFFRADYQGQPATAAPFRLGKA